MKTQRSDGAFDGPDPKDHELGTGSGPERLAEYSLRKILTPGRNGEINFAALAKVPNDSIVRVNLGKLERIDAYGRVFEVRKLEIPKNVPGTDHEIPPIHIFTDNEFNRLRARLSIPESEADLGRIRRVLAHYDRNTGDIDVRLRQTTGDQPSEFVEMTGGELKRAVGVIYHEMRHGARENEFFAYLHEMRALQASGAPGERLSVKEIMDFIQANYGDTELANSIEEFQASVSDSNFPEVTDEDFRTWMDTLTDSASKLGFEFSADELEFLDEYDSDY